MQIRQEMPYIYLRNCNCNEICIYHGYILYKVKIFFFHKISFLINKLFPHLRETLYTGRVKLFAEASELFTQAVFQLVVVVVVRKTASSEFIFRDAKKMEVGGC